MALPVLLACESWRSQKLFESFFYFSFFFRAIPCEIFLVAKKCAPVTIWELDKVYIMEREAPPRVESHLPRSADVWYTRRDGRRQRISPCVRAWRVAADVEGKDDDDSDIPDDRGRTKAPSKNKDLIALALRPDCVGYCNSAFALFLMHEEKGSWKCEWAMIYNIHISC